MRGQKSMPMKEDSEVIVNSVHPVTGEPYDFICWGINRRDKRSGYVGKPIVISSYTEKLFRASMQKWGKNYDW